MRTLFFAVLVAALTLSVCVSADTIHMRDGRKLEGKIVSQKEETIELKMKYGTITLRRSDIERIERDAPEKDKPEKPAKPKEKDQPAQQKAPVKQTPEKKKHPSELEKQWIEELKSDDLGTRRRALDCVARVMDKEDALKYLLAATKDKAWQMRYDAALLLWRTHDKRAVEPVIDLLYDKEEKVREGAVISLGWLQDSRATDHLIDILKDEESKKLYESTIMALGRIGDKKAAAPIIDILKGKSRRGYLWRGIEALGNIGGQQAIEFLIEDQKCSREAAGALRTIGKEALKPLIAALRNNDAEIRGNAASILGSMKDSTAVTPLIAALSDKEAKVRQSCVSALGSIRAHSAIEPLIKMLKEDEDKNVRYVALRTIAELDYSKATDAIIGALRDKEQDVAESAVRILGEHREKKAVEALVKVLNDDTDSVRDLVVIPELGKIGDERAVDAIAAKLSSEEGRYEKVCNRAAAALGEIGSKKGTEPLIAFLKRKGPGAGAIAITALEKIGDQSAVDALRDFLIDDKGKVNKSIVRALLVIGGKKALDSVKAVAGESGVLQVLESIGAPAVEIIALLLEHENVGTRTMAARALFMIADKKAVPALIKALKNDENSNVRSQCAMALGRMHVKEALDPLIEALGDENRRLQSAAARALEFIPDKKAVEPLMKLLTGEDTGLRIDAALALGAIGDRQAVPAIIKAFKEHTYKSGRLEYVKVLGRLRDERAIEVLLPLLEEKDHQMLLAVVDALGDIGGAKAVEPLSKLAGHRVEQISGSALLALGKIGGKRAVEVLMQALKDKDGSKRSAAARALGEAGDKNAVSALIEALRDKGPLICLYAADSLVKLCKDGAPAAVKAMFRSEEESIITQLCAAQVLVQLEKDDEAFEFLLKGLKSETRWAGTTAIDALRAISDVRAVKPLISALGNRDLRFSAEITLRSIGRPAVPYLIEALGHQDRSIRYTVASVLGEITKQRFRDNQEQWREWWEKNKDK